MRRRGEGEEHRAFGGRGRLLQQHRRRIGREMSSPVEDGPSPVAGHARGQICAAAACFALRRPQRSPGRCWSLRTYLLLQRWPQPCVKGRDGDPTGPRGACHACRGGAIPRPPRRTPRTATACDLSCEALRDTRRREHSTPWPPEALGIEPHPAVQASPPDAAPRMTTRRPSHIARRGQRRGRGYLSRPGQRSGGRPGPLRAARVRRRLSSDRQYLVHRDTFISPCRRYYCVLCRAYCRRHIPARAVWSDVCAAGEPPSGGHVGMLFGTERSLGVSRLRPPVVGSCSASCTGLQGHTIHPRP